MNWVIIALIVAAVVVVSKFIHFHHAKNKFFSILLVLLVGFFLLSFYSVAKNNSIDLKNPAGFFSAVKFYFFWLGQAFGNMKTITGNAVNMDWSFNSTN